MDDYQKEYARFDSREKLIKKGMIPVVKSLSLDTVINYNDRSFVYSVHFLYFSETYYGIHDFLIV